MRERRNAGRVRRSVAWLSMVALSLLVACSGDEPVQAQPQAVYVSQARNATAHEQRRFSGVIAPRVESHLAFQAGGKMLERLVQEGDHVRAGMPVARLDPKDLRLAEQAADQQVQAARADADQSASDAARFTRLLADGSVAAADAERQQARADAAAARLAQAQAQLTLARNRVAYATLVAPFSGVVTAVRGEPGQVVAEGTPVFTLARSADIDVVIDLPEQLAAGVRDWRVTGRLAADPEAVEHALVLREVAPAASRTTRTVRVRYAAPSTAVGWTLGRSVDVRMERPDSRDGATLPVSSIVSTDGRSTVWLVNPQDGSLQRKEVEPLAQGAGTVRVKGLPDGALVVSVGAHRLDEGLRVRPVPRDPGTPPAAGATDSTQRTTP